MVPWVIVLIYILVRGIAWILVLLQVSYISSLLIASYLLLPNGTRDVCNKQQIHNTIPPLDSQHPHLAPPRRKPSRGTQHFKNRNARSTKNYLSHIIYPDQYYIDSPRELPFPPRPRAQIQLRKRVRLMW